MTILKQVGLILFPLLGLTGCAQAPNIDIAGSFFPSWMVCLAIGIALTLATRTFLEKRKLEGEIGTLAVFYPALAVLLSCLLWLLFFR